MPSEAEVEKMLKEILGLKSKIEKYGTVLTPAARLSALKPPDGGEATSKLIVKLLKEHKVSLPGVKPDDIEADGLLAERLAPVSTALDSLLRLVDDTVLQANSERWSGTTAGYTALVRTMDADPALQAALDPAMKAFGVGRKRPPRKGGEGGGGAPGG